MTIAVTFDRPTGTVFGHFGRTEYFLICHTEDGKIVSSEVVSAAETGGHSALAPFLKEKGVEALIAGGMGMGARNALDAVGIKVYPGAEGDAEEAVKAFLDGTLDYNPDTTCSHHHEDGESCGHHHEGGCSHSHGDGHHCCH